jgi:hypothetical protein
MPRSARSVSPSNSLLSAVTDEPLRMLREVTGNGDLSIQVGCAFLSGFRSGTEEEWFSSGHSRYIEAHFQSPVIWWGYEWMSFNVPGGSYTPDYAYILKSSQMIFVEVKGSRAQANYRDARSKLRGAASLNPWFTFCEVRITKKAWEFEIIKGNDYQESQKLSNNDLNKK